MDTKALAFPQPLHFKLCSNSIRYLEKVNFLLKSTLSRDLFSVPHSLKFMQLKLNFSSHMSWRLFSLLWFLFQLVVSRSKKGNKEQMFLLHPQLLWAQMWQKRLLRRGIMFSYWHSAPRVTRAASAGQILCFFLVYSFLSHSGSDNVLKCNSRIRANHQYNLSVL